MSDKQTVFEFRKLSPSEGSSWMELHKQREEVKSHNSSHEPQAHTKTKALAQDTHADEPREELSYAYHNIQEDTRRNTQITHLKRVFKGFMFGGLLGLLVLAWPFLYIEGRFRLDQLTPEVKSAEQLKVETEYPKVESPSFQYLLNQKYLDILKPVDPEFSVIIPKLSINSKVVPNVDVSDKKVYEPALKQGAAHAKGTYFPGENGTTFIFAHSTNYEWFVARYNAIFYLLKDLEKDDQVHLVYKNTVYPYKVVEKKIIKPADIEYLTPHKGREELILQTCYPPGTTEKRLLIIARPTTDAPRVPSLSYSLDK